MSDYVQQLRECLVAALDSDASIAAFTGRPNRNLVPFADVGSVDPPVIGYHVVDADDRRGVLGEYHAVVQFSALASDEGAANRLLGALLEACTHNKLAAATPGIDAAVLSVLRRTEGPDPELEVARADADVEVLYSLIPPPPPDPLGVLALGDAVSAHGAQLVVAWHGAGLVAAGGVLTTWPASYGMATLDPFGDRPIPVDATARSITLDPSQRQYLLCDDPALAAIAASCAGVLVCRKPTNLVSADAVTLARLSNAAGQGMLTAWHINGTATDQVNSDASGFTGNCNLNLGAMAGRQTLHFARARLGGGTFDRFSARRGRGPLSTSDSAGLAVNGPAALLAVGTTFSGGAAGNLCAMPDLAAIVLLALADGAEYTDALASLVETWAETYAGATP
jgi:hypothetical protein